MANWDLIEVLGVGCFGKVMLAKQTTKGSLEYIAIKSAPLERSSTLSKEEQILKHFIGCPEIVQCFGSEVTTEPISSEAIYNLKLEYTAGGSLAHLIQRRKTLPEDEAKEYLRMILRGLSSIHDKGFVHADIKPENILAFPQRDGKMKLKIADFGCSMRCGGKNENCDRFGFKGSPMFMSPESIRLPEFNAGLDIWSLGCVLIEMVSGEWVWNDRLSPEQLMKKLVFDMEIPQIPLHLSVEGKDFVKKCLHQDFTRRWTADMLLQHPYLKQQNEQQHYDDEEEEDTQMCLPQLNQIFRLLCI